MIFIPIITEGYNSNKYGITVLVLCTCLMMLYMCVKFYENILNGFKATAGHHFHTYKYKGDNS